MEIRRALWYNAVAESSTLKEKDYGTGLRAGLQIKLEGFRTMSKKFVYLFSEGNGKMRELLGG